MALTGGGSGYPPRPVTRKEKWYTGLGAVAMIAIAAGIGTYMWNTRDGRYLSPTSPPSAIFKNLEEVRNPDGRFERDIEINDFTYVFRECFSRPKPNDPYGPHDPDNTRIVCAYDLTRKDNGERIESYSDYLRYVDELAEEKINQEDKN